MYQRINGHIDDWSQIWVHTNEQTQIHSAQSTPVVSHQSKY